MLGSDSAARVLLLASIAAAAGCNVIFGIESGHEAPDAAATLSAGTSGAGGGGAGGGGGNTGTGGGDGGGGGGGGAVCPTPTCAVGDCAVENLTPGYGSETKGMALTDSRVLWANGSSIDFLLKDGSGLGTLVGTGGLGSTIWVAVSGGQLSWVNWDTSIVRGISLEPPSQTPFTIADVPPQAEPVGSYYGRITTFADHVYWATQTPAAVWRALSDGSGQLEQITTVGLPEGVAVSSSHVYWADNSAAKILRKPTDSIGTNAEVFAQTSGAPTAVVVQDDVVYWVTNGGAVQSKAASAALAQPPFTHALDPQAVAKAIAVDSAFVYWTVYRNELLGGQGEIRRAPKGSAEAVTLVSGQPYFFEIAVDCGAIYWNINNLDGGDPGSVHRMPHPQ